jgi:hypothetical protein
MGQLCLDIKHESCDALMTIYLSVTQIELFVSTDKNTERFIPEMILEMKSRLILY